MKKAVDVVKTAHGLGVDDELNIQGSAGPSTVAVSNTSSLPALLAAAPFVHPGTPPSPASPPVSGDQQLVFSGDDDRNDKMHLLFSKFDEMSLSVAFAKIVPAVRRADEQGQYLAICVNIQLAALAVNYIQSVRFVIFGLNHLLTVADLERSRA